MAEAAREAGGRTNVTRRGSQPPPVGPHPRAAARLSRWWWLGWLVPLAVQAAHTALVAPSYHVGSFDDDGNYLMAAHVLASGGGLTTRMASGSTVVANYLPGYPLLLVPLVWAWGGNLLAPRVLSVACVAALYPLTWAWTGRRGMRPSLRAAVLVVMALNEVLATYSTMVMAEAPFLVVLLLALFAVGSWETRPGWRPALASVVTLGFAVWLKEAGVGLAVGLACYWVWRRRWRPAFATAAGCLLVVAPGLLARWSTGASVVGNRYLGEISSPGAGGLLHQVAAEVVDNVASYAQDVLRSSVLPVGNPLASGGPVHWLVVVLGASVPVFCVIGAVVWYRCHPRAETWMVGAYFLETLAYPYNNQRRIILVLPVVTLWYVVGGVAGWRRASQVANRAWGHGAGRLVVSCGLVLATIGLSVPSAEGFSANYLFGVGRQSSQFAGTPAMTLLAAIGNPASVVETDYRGSVAFFTGHRTAWSAFTVTTRAGPTGGEHASTCTVGTVERALRGDHADFVLVGDLNFPGLVDSPCLLAMASGPTTARSIGAVRLLSSSLDNTSVFELAGPASCQPSLVDRTAGVAPTTAGGGPVRRVALPPNGQGDHGATAYDVRAVRGRARLVWSFGRPRPVAQVTLGLADSSAPVEATTVEVEPAPGVWTTVAKAAGAVGGGAHPYLLARLPAPARAMGVMVTVVTAGTARIGLLHVLGRSR